MTALARVLSQRAVQLRRDPFARATLMRVLVWPVRACLWCGSRPGRFGYFWDNDSMMPRNQKLYAGKIEGFCCVSCWEEYHA